MASLGDQVSGDIKVNLIKTSFRGNVKAFVELNEEAVTSLVKEERIKVAWVNCKVKQGDKALRCYRCHGYGYLAAGCKAEDRGKLCWRCGKEGQKAFECEAPPHCYLCAEIKVDGQRNDHIPRSRWCAAYYAAKKDSRNKNRWR